MEYTILELASMAGISTRTLRYYEQIGLLCPAGRTETGYRLYTQEEVDALQLILFYKELGLPLAAIKDILQDPGFDRVTALHQHLKELKEKQRQIEQLIRNVTNTLKAEKGEGTMTNKEKFEGLKKELLEENEEKYGVEIREKYGVEEVEKSNAKLMNLSEEQYGEMTELGRALNQLLVEAVRKGEAANSEMGKKACEMHREWLSYTWPSYTKEAHVGLTQMYVADERFRAYYDGEVEGCAGFLREAVGIFAK